MQLKLTITLKILPSIKRLLNFRIKSLHTPSTEKKDRMLGWAVCWFHLKKKEKKKERNKEKEGGRG